MGSPLWINKNKTPDWLAKCSLKDTWPVLFVIGELYNVNFVSAAIFPDSGLNIKALVDYETENFLMIYPYTKEGSYEYIQFRRIGETELKVVGRNMTVGGDFDNFEVGKILKLANIEIVTQQ